MEALVNPEVQGLMFKETLSLPSAPLQLQKFGDEQITTEFCGRPPVENGCI